MQTSRIRFIALVLGIALAFGGCNLFKSFEAPDDNAITSAIQAKLYQDTALKTRDVRVVSQKGVVVLTGTVASETEKSNAENLASSVPGVKQIIDQISVAPPATTAEAAPPVTETRQRSYRPERRSIARPAAPEMPAETSAAPAPPQAPSNAPAAPAPPPPAQPVSVTIPAGTVITVRTIDTVDSSKNHPGDEFAATVDAPVAQDNRVIIPRNSDARLQLAEVASAGHIKGRSEVKLQLVSISVHGVTYPVQSGYFDKQGASRGKRSAETIGGGAALGGLIGAIAGHGKGAAIGAAIGAGAGTAVQATTKGQQVVIPSETKIDFTLRSPVTVTVQP